MESGPQQGMSRWTDPQGKVFWKNCTIIDYDEKSKLFTIQWTNTNKAKLKQVKRLNVLFYFDDVQEFKQRYGAAIAKREEYLREVKLNNMIKQSTGDNHQNVPIERINKTIDKIS